MQHRHRRFPALRSLLGAMVLGLLLSPRAAQAWIETSIRSDAVVLDIAPDGRSEVRHELVMRIRGGPLKGFELPGVDADADPLPNATVSPVNGASARDTHPLLIERRDDGTLRIDVDHDKGLRRGTYLFKFAYRTNLAQRGGLTPRGNFVALRWVGPRFSDGVDSVRVVFRVPAATEPPQLDTASSGQQEAEGAGVFLSTLRRAHDKDELEVVRPHVAKGEPVVWEALASRRAFPAFAPSESAPAPMTRASAAVSPERRAWMLGGLLFVALCYALLVFLKGRALSRSSAQRGAVCRAFVPLPLAVRATLSGALLAGAAAVALSTVYPTVAAALLVASMALSTQLAPRQLPAPRAPGRWLPFSEDDAFGVPAKRLPGRWLDAGTLPGFAVFVLLLACFVVGALWLLPRSVYHAMMVLLASASLLPVFLTGRGSTLPADRARAPMRALQWLGSQLKKYRGVKVVPWVRLPDGCADADELRLLIMPKHALSGLGAIEVGLEYDTSAAGTLEMPWVIVRAAEGSRAHEVLSTRVTCSRGRKSHERVAVLWPALPTRQSSLALVLELIVLLSETGRPQSKSNDKSWGRSSATLKDGSVPSPAHAT